MDNVKPVIVRVKRKSLQSAVDALWIEIQERPLKRPLLDFARLSISKASSITELKSKKVLVERVETINNTEETFHVLQSFLEKPSDERYSKDGSKGRRSIMSSSIPDQLLAKAKQSQEALARNARFDQIWKSRRTKNEGSEAEAINDMCQFYDIVRVDDEGIEAKVDRDNHMSLEDSKMLAAYLPLLREVYPAAASEIEREDEYVYDFYAVTKDAEYTVEDSEGPFPLVQVAEDDDLYDGDSVSEYDSEDSNVENHPRNDYPDEETSDEEDSDALTSRDDEDDPEDDSESSSRVDLDHDQETDSMPDDPGYPDDASLDYGDYFDDCDDDNDDEFDAY